MPGPMAFIPQYQARANGIEPVRYVTPEYEEFTKDTFGILVYQEQCMLLVQRMAGYSPGEADTFRKAIGKKKESVMRPALEELRRRLAEHNHKQEVIDEIIKQIEPFVGGYAPAESNLCSQTPLIETGTLKAFLNDSTSATSYPSPNNAD